MQRRRDREHDDAGVVEPAVGLGQLVEDVAGRRSAQPRPGDREARSRPRRRRAHGRGGLDAELPPGQPDHRCTSRRGPGRTLGRAPCRPAPGPPGRARRPSRPGRGSGRRCGRRACDCRSVWLAETTVLAGRQRGRVAARAGEPVVGGQQRRRPRRSTRTRESTSTIRWSQTRSRSATRCEDSTTLKLVLGDGLHQALQELAPGQRVEAGHRLVQDQQLRPLGQAEGQRELGPLAAGEPAGLLARVEAEPRRSGRGPARRPSAGLSRAPSRRWSRDASARRTSACPGRRTRPWPAAPGRRPGGRRRPRSCRWSGPAGRRPG